MSAAHHWIVVVSIATGCSESGGGNGDGGLNGTPMSCPSPGNPKANGNVGCGTERWAIKVGQDPQAPSIPLVAVPNTIAALVALPANGAGNARESPTETTIYELKNVILTELKLETDSDYHLVLSDGSATLIAEIPYQQCDGGSPWMCFISKSRSDVDAMFNVNPTPQYPTQTVTVRGVGFFDILHGQAGVAPNAIELHPVLEICFGKDCVLP